MPRRTRLVALLAGAIALAAPLALAQPAAAPPPQEPLVVRYTTWMIVMGPTEVASESRPYGSLHDDYTYRDQPSYGVLSLEGETLQTLDGGLAATATLTVPGAEPVLLRLHPGANYAVPRPVSGTYWYVATEDAPLNVVRGFEQLYFWLPPGLRAGTIFCHAFSPGEAARLVVSDMLGNEIASLESDFDEPEALTFRLTQTSDEGEILRLSLLAPENPDWTLDDAAVWLGDELPGLLAPSFAAAMGSHAVAEAVGIETDWTLLRDFEGANPIQTIQWSKLVEEGAELPAYDVALSDEQPFSGGQSLRVEMRFAEDMIDRQELKLFTEPLDVPSVRKVRFFLYGDNSGRRMVVRVRDAGQEHHYVDVGAIDWMGWKAVVAEFEHATRGIAGGDENRQIDGPPVTVVIQIQHGRDDPAHSVLYIDDLSVRPQAVSQMGEQP